MTAPTGFTGDHLGEALQALAETGVSAAEAGAAIAKNLPIFIQVAKDSGAVMTLGDVQDDDQADPAA